MERKKKLKRSGENVDKPSDHGDSDVAEDIAGARVVNKPMTAKKDKRRERSSRHDHRVPQDAVDSRVESEPKKKKNILVDFTFK